MPQPNDAVLCSLSSKSGVTYTHHFLQRHQQDIHKVRLTELYCLLIPSGAEMPSTQSATYSQTKHINKRNKCNWNCSVSKTVRSMVGWEMNLTVHDAAGGANVPSMSRLKQLIPLMYSTLELKFSLSSCSLLSHFHPSFFPSSYFRCAFLFFLTI